MKLLTLFKQQPNKQFNYTPRYYDEKKERRNKLTKGVYQTNSKRIHFRNSWKYEKSVKATKQQSRNKLILIFISLILVCYLLLRKFIF